MYDTALLCCIVAHEKGSRVLKTAKANGVSGGTVMIGLGTVKNRLLEILDLDETRREIVVMAAPHGIARTAAEALTKDMSFRKPGHGIAFIIPLISVIGSKNIQENKIGGETPEGAEGYMHNAIFTIVDRGQAEEVVDAAKTAGARGGTIIHARGSGIHETAVLFAMPVEPEREIVLIIARSEQTPAVTDAIRRKMNIDEPGRGIIFVSPVSETFGLHEDGK